MRKLILSLCFSLSILCCQAQETPAQFSEAALNQTLVNLEDESVTFQEIIDHYKGKTVLIDIWASWCKDCIKGLPNLKTLQKEHPEIVYLFLSLDKKNESWKKGIKKYDIQGQHYFMASGWENDFTDFIKLDWIPRYLVLDSKGNITVFKAITIDDEKLQAAIN